MKITIRNWDKYNKRKDLKRPWWFALSNRLLEDPDFYEFNAEEIRAWIYILSQASQKRTGDIELSLVHAEKACNVKINALKSAISKLLKKEILSDPIGCRTDSERSTVGTLQDKTEQDITKQDTIAHFEECASELYSLYPKKVGKKKAFAKLKTVLNSKNGFENVRSAIMNYIAKLERDKTDAKFIKQFDTFMNCYEDYLDPDVGEAKSFKHRELTEEDLNDSQRI